MEISKGLLVAIGIVLLLLVIYIIREKRKKWIHTKELYLPNGKLKSKTYFIEGYEYKQFPTPLEAKAFRRSLK